VGQDGQKCPKVNVFLEWQPQGQMRSDLIKISAPFALTSEVPRTHQFTDDSLGLALSDVKGAGDISQT
jgi:hypothetical protein